MLENNDQLAALFAAFAMRETLREAVFLCSTPFAAALSIATTAAFIAASLSAAPAEMAAFAFLTTVFRLDLIALLCRFSFLAS